LKKRNKLLWLVKRLPLYHLINYKMEHRTKRFENKVCIVTGGSSGIGKATAMQLAQEGGKVAILNRKEEEGKKAADEIRHSGGDVINIKADTGKVEDLEAAVKTIIEKWDKIDVLVNNAAMMTYKPIAEISVEEFDEVMAVNLRGVFVLCKLCLPFMQKGAIVNVSSVHAHETTPNVIPYAASKGGMEAFSRGLSREYDASKVRVNCIEPGAVDTPMLRNNPNVKSGIEKVEGAIGKPEEIAAAICFLASDEASFINGTVLVVDGGRLQVL
jgi:NAD(P)-dependent dehydrogenase (short-subunit alcohol dehydrogenase family)